MKTAQQINDKIKEIEKAFSSVLSGSIATVEINAPRALMQLSAEEMLKTLHWVLGTTYKSKLRRVNR